MNHLDILKYSSTSTEPLDQSSPRYKIISDELMDGNSSKLSIETVELINNPYWSECFEFHSGALAKKNGAKPNALYLWHGTSLNNAKKIIETGYNHRFGNIMNYGIGIYHAVNSSLALQYSSGDELNQFGLRCIFVSRVLVGDYTNGQNGMVVPPKKSNGIRFDSFTDNITNPTLFVVPADYHCYPAYTVYFRYRTDRVNSLQGQQQAHDRYAAMFAGSDVAQRLGTAPKMISTTSKSSISSINKTRKRKLNEMDDDEEMDDDDDNNQNQRKKRKIIRNKSNYSVPNRNNNNNHNMDHYHKVKPVQSTPSFPITLQVQLPHFLAPFPPHPTVPTSHQFSRATLQQIIIHIL